MSVSKIAAHPDAFPIGLSLHSYFACSQVVRDNFRLLRNRVSEEVSQSAIHTQVRQQLQPTIFDNLKHPNQGRIHADK